MSDVTALDGFSARLALPVRSDHPKPPLCSGLPGDGLLDRVLLEHAQSELLAFAQGVFRPEDAEKLRTHGVKLERQIRERRGESLRPRRSADALAKQTPPQSRDPLGTKAAHLGELTLQLDRNRLQLSSLLVY